MINDLHTQNHSINFRINDFNSSLGKKLDQVEDGLTEYCNSIKKRVEDIEQLAHVEYMREKVVPMINSFQASLEEYQKTNLEVKECIRLFDITISTKANKALLA